jgi:hypothetical protein
MVQMISDFFCADWLNWIKMAVCLEDSESYVVDRTSYS